MNAAEKIAKIREAQKDLFLQEKQLRLEIQWIINEEFGAEHDSLVSLAHMQQGVLLGANKITIFLSTGPPFASQEIIQQKMKNVEQKTGIPTVLGL